jgi:hypothetical protein
MHIGECDHPCMGGAGRATDIQIRNCIEGHDQWPLGSQSYGTGMSFSVE